MVDYKELGFRCGLEIHQQVDSGKLFCRCPSLVHDVNPTIHMIRRLRAVAGEAGRIDTAALYEATKAKMIMYEGCSTSTCLVELDEEPPQVMDSDALIVAIQVAKLLHAHVVDEVLVMRKIVIDGSNVSGFQRTALIAQDGFVETSKGRVLIPMICLEEESAQKIGEEEGKIMYRLDRLGVPLIEVSTGTDILDPEHAKEVAHKIGMILRSTGKVKRGIGSIRQDVNVSIHGGARIEIKGFQELRSIPNIIEFEIARQLNLIKIGTCVESQVRKAEPDLTTSFLRPMPGAQRMYPETDIPSVPLAISFVESISTPILLDEQVKDLVVRFGIDHDTATSLTGEGWSMWFVDVVQRCKNLKASYIADLLFSISNQVKKKYDVDVVVSSDDLMELCLALDAGVVSKEAVVDVVVCAWREHSSIRDVLGQFRMLSDVQLRIAVKQVIDKNPGVSFNALVGKVMEVLRGKADGKKIIECVKMLL